jgi:hypothetical protein
MWGDIGFLCVLIVTSAFAAIVIWALWAASRELIGGIRSALRNPRFDLLDLLLLVTVLAISLASIRWFWNSIYLGMVLLVVPMAAPLPWLAKFLYEDARLARQKRRQQREMVVESFEVPFASEHARRPVHRLTPSQPKRMKIWIPPLTPLSLAARPLQDDG